MKRENLLIIDDDYDIVIGDSNSVLTYFKEEVVDYYIDNVLYEDIDSSDLYEIVKTFALLKRYSCEDRGQVIKLSHDYDYNFKIEVARFEEVKEC